MTYEQLAKLAEEVGFTAWTPLDIATIELRPEVRDMCAANSCGMYGKNWSCPPGCGTLEACSSQLREYSHGILVQTVGRVEDSFDFEAMMKIEAEHKSLFAKMFNIIWKSEEKILALGTGCCTQCAECTYPNAPCRFPKKKISSMEAYGMLVLEICEMNHLPYYYGSDKIVYTSCFLIQ